MKNNSILVYKASAGSGKTYTLAAEYIARLLAGEDEEAYRHLLAVTFTNKATTEMKERILQRLWDLAWTDTDFIEAVEARLPGVSREDIRRRAGMALSAIIHDYDRFRVETIDSFFQSLLSNLAHELGLSANFRPDINDRDVTAQAVDRLMAELPEKPDVLSWVLSYIKERIDDNRKWDITFEVKKLAVNLLKEKFLRNEERLKTALSDAQGLRDYRQELDNAAAEAEDHIKNAAEHLDSLITDSDCGVGYKRICHGNWLQSFLERLMKGDFEAPSQSVLNFIDSADAWVKSSAKEKDKLSGADIEPLREVLATVEKLRASGEHIINSCRLSTRHINPMRLLNEIAREMNTINDETNRFMLARTPQLFERLVGEDDASFVFEKAGTTFRHIMIDEFQDTSPLQWGNFKRLLVENAATAGNCLLVGDAKQGIYRFRGGDWSILEGIASEFRNAVPDIRNLDTNFRSAKHIVDFNNEFFPTAAEVIDGIENTDALRPLYKEVEQKSKSEGSGYVRLLIDAGGKKKEDEETENAYVGNDEDLAGEISRLHTEYGIEYNKMAILVRYNSEATRLQQFFAEKHSDIPLVSDEAFLLSSSEVVQTIIHALRYLNDSQDSIALAYISDRYRNTICAENADWNDIISEGEECLPKEFREERKQLKRMPLYELCERLLEIFKAEKAQADAPYIFCFLDQVMAFLEENPSDIARFLKHWNETLAHKAIPSGKTDGIYILTIHKSKGLAFHTVLLPACDWELEKDKQNDTLWFEPPVEPYNKIPLLPISPNTSVRQSVYSEQYLHEHLQRRMENLNLLYVAFTRPVQNLLIWCKKRGKEEATTTMGDIIYQCMSDKCTNEDNIFIYESGEPQNKAWNEKTPNDDSKPKVVNPLEFKPDTVCVPLTSHDVIAKFMQSNESKKFVEEGTDTDAAQQDKYISQGKLLHQIFSTIRTAADIDNALDGMERSGVIGSETDKAALRAFIERCLSHPIAAKWFDGTWKLFNECSILLRDEHGTPKTVRPDRVMTKGKHAVVIDFKFGRRNEAYRYEEQVRKYIRPLQKMGYRPVEGFLWYMYSGEIDSVTL